MEVVSGFLSDILRDLVCGAVDQLRYPCCFDTFVEELRKEESDLITTRGSVQDRVDHGKKQAMKTDEVVHKWLKDADISIQDVNELLDKATTKKSCCSSHCPNWIFRYHFGRKLTIKIKELEEFITKGDGYLKNLGQLQRVAILPPEPLNLPPDKCLTFKSREYAYNQVMEAVKDENVSMIGLYGMGGCGKTTLAEEINKIAVVDHLFDKVLFLTVSSASEVRRIQEKIASSIRYKFQADEERDRARALYDRLTQENKILVILDDVWERLDFGAIGIPLPHHHKGCKVLITTRSEDVCTLMDCQKKIQLQVLEDDEAWTLFQKQAQISEDTSDSLKHLARKISDECKGLPVAIVAVACSLKGKDEVIWKDAMNKLRSSKPLNIEKGLRDPYKCLQLSYDNLDHEEAKSLFLLCSVFPEDHLIKVERLIRFAIGLGVVGEIRSYDEARSGVIAAKIKLVSSSLLMSDGDEHVKMHDLVRDVAHFIAKNQNKVIKCNLKNDVTSEQNSVKYLCCQEFPNDLDCSNLEFLCISTKLEILDENFKRMENLKVLFLKNKMWRRVRMNGGEAGYHYQLCHSLRALTNLRSLFLVGWKLSDISFVRDSKKLQSLSFHRCLLPSFLDSQMDDAVKQLTNLKLLEFIDCEMKRNNYKVIGGIPHLEELRIYDENQEWDDCNEDTIELFNMLSVLPLQCFAIQFGCLRYDPRKLVFSREGILALNCFHASNEAIKSLAERAKVIIMEKIQGAAKNIIPDVFQIREDSTNKLNALEICNGKEIECLVDTSNLLSEVPTLFSQLLELNIKKMKHLKVLWNGCLPPGRETFQKLETLYLKNCPELTSLFTHSAGSFTLSNLTRLELYSCPKLSSLFSESTAETLTSLKELIIKGCNGLKHIVSPERAHRNKRKEIVEDDHNLQSVISIFPNLKAVHISHCAKLEVIFALRCLPELQSLVVKSCKRLKEIMEQGLEEEDKNLSNPLSTQPCFPKLKELVVERCKKLRSVFSTFASIDLSNLEILVINRAARLEELIGCQHGKDHKIEKANVELPKLKLIILMHLPNLCQGIELQAVKHRIVQNSF